MVHVPPYPRSNAFWRPWAARWRGLVEADETYYGPIEKSKVRTKTTSGRPFTKSGRSGPANKRPIVPLVERDGNVRTFHVPVADKENVTRIVRENIAKESRLHTDDSKLYSGPISISRRTERSNTAPTNTCAMRTASPSTTIQRKATSRSSNAECAVFISTAKRSICIATLPSSITATIIAWRSATATSTAPLPRSAASKASG